MSEKQMHVCNKISEMKSTWEDVAHFGYFNSSLENVLSEQRKPLEELQQNVSLFLNPFQKAREFLTWTWTQTRSITDLEGLDPYPSSEYDDIILEEYLISGAVIILNLNTWIENSTFLNWDLESRRIIGFD